MIHFELESDRELLGSAMEFAQNQVRRLVESRPDVSPMYTKGGVWKHDGPKWTNWCDGFLPGMMWIIYARQPAGSPESRWWREQAIRYSRALEPRKLDRNVHDLGFVFMSSYRRWFGFTPDPSLKAVLVEAARRTDPDHPVARSIR